MAAAPQSTQSSAATPDWAAITEQICCPLCEYNLRGLIEPRCPECGYQFTWPDVLDPRRGLHPYLFEHHPERNLRSFARTAVAGFRPGTFWRSLNPVQPSRPRRLIAYWLAGAVLYWLAVSAYALLPTLTEAILENMDRATLLAGRPPSWMTPQVASRILARYGSFPAYAKSVSPPVSIPRRLGPALVGLGAHWVLLALPVAWPWATFASLLVFQWSMRAAKLRPIHLLRAAVYCFDMPFWVGLLVLTLYLPVGMWVCLRPSSRAWFITLAPPEEFLPLALIWAVILTVGMVRLGRACKYYLQFKRPVATVLASQVMVLLFALNVFGLVLDSIWHDLLWRWYWWFFLKP